MKKKLLTLLLSIAMITGLMPLTAYANDADAVTIDGQPYSETQLSVDMSGTGWFWNASEKELTLCNYNGSYIKSRMPITINVEEGTSNTISVPESIDQAGIYFAAPSSLSCVIEGNGDLKIDSHSYGILSTADELVIQMNGDLAISSGDTGIYSDKELHLCGHGSTSVKTTGSSWGIYARNDIHLYGSQRVSVDSDDVGIKTSSGSLSISGSSEILVNAVKRGLDANCGVSIYTCGKVIVNSSGSNAVWTSSPKDVIAVKMNGTGAPISFKSASGYAAIVNAADSGSMIGGDNIDTYTMTGSPGSRSVIFDKTVLTINRHDYSGTDLTSNINKTYAEGWSWYAASEKLFLNGYNGHNIKRTGSIDILLEDGKQNHIDDTIGPGYGIYTTGNCTITGRGDLSINDSCSTSGIQTLYGGLYIDIDGSMKIESNEDGITSYSYASISCSRGLNIYASDNAVFSQDRLTLSGDGDYIIYSGNNSLSCNDDISITTGGKVIVNSASGYAVRFGKAEKSLLLNGTGFPLCFTSGDGKAAVFNIIDNTSSVGGVCLDDYTMSGSPDSTYVVYDKRALIINGHTFNGFELEANIDRMSTENWHWTADNEELYLAGYNGSAIYADRDLDVILSKNTDNRITGGGSGIRTFGDCLITGGGDLTIDLTGNYSEGITVSFGDLLIDTDGDLKVTAGRYGIYSYNDINITGNGNINVKSGQYGISADLGVLKISGGGNISVNSGDFSLGANKDVILSGSGELTAVSSGSVAVSTYIPGASLYLNGTGAPLTFIAADGCTAVYNDARRNSPVGGTNLSEYYLTGSPAQDIAIYDNAPKPAVPFTDIKKSDWFYCDAVYAFRNGLMNGTSGTEFSPNQKTTRAMIVTILYRIDGSPAVSGSCSFKDVKQGMWYTDPVIWANKNGIVQGYSSTEFGTDDNISREQMAAILYRYSNYKGYDVSKTKSISSFTDASKVSDYFIEAMKWAYGNGLINGTSETTLSPKDGASRAQVAAILHRFIIMRHA